MTEEEIRRIVREEVEMEALKVDGIYDHCRTVAFGMLRSVLEMLAKNTFEAFAHNDRSETAAAGADADDEMGDDEWPQASSKPH